MNGSPSDVEQIFDAHTHLPTAGFSGNRGMFADYEKAVAYLQKAGTTRALFNTWRGVLATTEAELEQGNADALRLAAEYNGFLVPGAVIHPAFPKASLRWLAAFRGAGSYWVGELLCSGQVRYADPDFMALFAECARYQHVVQLHLHEEILTVARAFPKLRIVCAHINVELCVELAKLPNVWLDISGANGGLWVGAIEQAYQIFGYERLLYGTDFSGYEPRAFQERLKMAVPDVIERKSILYGNSAQLIQPPHHQ